MESLDNYLEEKVNFGVEDRNSPYINFADSSIDLETENFNIHLSNLGDHLISNPPNNNNTHGNFNLPGYVSSGSDNNSTDESEEENEIEKYMEEKNNESKKNLKKNLPEYFEFLDNKK